MAQDDTEENDSGATDAGFRESGHDSGPGPIRALTRGIDVLEALNVQPATVTDIARATRLPRTTVYRVLETLCALSLAARGPDERYRLLPSIRRLGDGYDDEPWIERIARPAVTALAKDLALPLTLATLHGVTLRGRSLSAVAAPFRLPLAGSSAGLVFLAACPDAQRRILLQRLKLSGAALPDGLEARIAEATARGYALMDDGAPELSLAVPVAAHEGGAIASLAVTFAREAVALEAAPERFTALLGRAASDIAAGFI